MMVDSNDSLTASRRDGAIKGWSVSADRAVRKGEMIGAAKPLLVHQTLANRKEVLVCANCHRFLGTEATQLAVLDGLLSTASLEDPTGTGSIHPDSADASRNGSRKRPRPTSTSTDNGNNDDAGGGRQRSWTSKSTSLSLPNRSMLQFVPTATRDRSRRMAVARAHPSQLPDLPCLSPLQVPRSIHNGEEGEGRWQQERELLLNKGGNRGGCDSCGVFGCERGAPCDDLFCSPACVNAAMTAGHGLICVGSREKGSPIHEFRRHAEMTSETYLIAAAGMAAAVSTGARQFEMLHGWEEPLRSGEDKETGVPTEEAEEAWSMLSAAFLYEDHLLNDVGNDGDDRDERTPGSPLPSTLGSEEGKVESFGRVKREVANGGTRKSARGSSAFTLDFFLRMLRALEKHLAPMMVPSPLVSYCTRLSQAPPEVKACALLHLSAAIARAGPCAGAGTDGEENEGEIVFLSDMKNGEEKARNAIDEDLACERALCRLVQAATAGGGVASSGPFPPLSVVGLLPPKCCPEHSCIPNVQLEASLLPSTMGRFYHDPAGDNAETTMNGGGIGNGGTKIETALRVGLVALRNISPGTELYAPYVALGQNVAQRRHELSATLSYCCSCPRCCLEADGDQGCGPEMLQILADQALEEGKHESALRLYNASLKEQKRTEKTSVSSMCYEGSSPLSLEINDNLNDPIPRGDALHGVGVALLAAGKFKEACRAWKRGVREAPAHPALRAQAEKETAYRPKPREPQDGKLNISSNSATNVSGAVAILSESCSNGRSEHETLKPTATRDVADSLKGDIASDATLDKECEGDHQKSSTYEYDAFTSTVLGGEPDVFMSKLPVLSPQECQDVIEAAGDYATANGGWTTSRHYAVPTTDLPVNVLEPILPWFRSLVSDRLFPSLAEQFNLEQGARGVSVHDAFVVRYEEGKQRHLPLHRDQSTHSFTIALNALEEYKGGGTFFPSLGRALRPEQGHVLAFRGSILHGGDPLLKGVRYIIACFCYADDVADTIDEFNAAHESLKGNLRSEKKGNKGNNTSGGVFQSDEEGAGGTITAETNKKAIGFGSSGGSRDFSFGFSL